MKALKPSLKKHLAMITPIIVLLKK